MKNKYSILAAGLLGGAIALTPTMGDADISGLNKCTPIETIDVTIGAGTFQMEKSECAGFGRIHIHREGMLQEGKPQNTITYTARIINKDVTLEFPRDGKHYSFPFRGTKNACAILKTTSAGGIDFNPLYAIDTDCETGIDEVLRHEFLKQQFDPYFNEPDSSKDQRDKEAMKKLYAYLIANETIKADLKRARAALHPVQTEKGEPDELDEFLRD